eukprot:scaffold292507_cov23-Tisochrysis_lutea.AAC.1
MFVTAIHTCFVLDSTCACWYKWPSIKKHKGNQVGRHEAAMHTPALAAGCALAAAPARALAATPGKKHSDAHTFALTTG